MIGNKKVLAVILARKGSKGIPGKNYRDILGKPLFIWSVQAALESKYIDKIVISSNCPNCKLAYYKCLVEKTIDTNDMTKQGRVEWIDRPDEISDDLSKNEEALIHTMDYLGSDKFDVVINLQVTSPCRLERLVDRCIEEYHEGGYDSLLTGSLTTPFLWRKKDNKWIYNIDYNDCCNRKMRQQFSEEEMLLHDNGNLYLTNSKILLDRECRIGYNPCIYETTGLNNLQIDEEFDFKLIENMAKAMGLESLI